MTSRVPGAQLLDLLFPPRCQVCGAFSENPLCETCRDGIEFMAGDLCAYCGIMLRDQPPEKLPGGLCPDCREGRWISAARSAGLHTGSLRDAIITYKFNGRRRLAGTFGRMLADVFTAEIEADRSLPLSLCAALVPVPLHPKRRHWRGFDQAELICEEFARRVGMPMWPDALERIRHTQPQTHVRGMSRRENVRGAFEARKPWRLEDASVVLVDDVFTTGATLDECAMVLKRAGAAAVYGLTVSRGVPRWYESHLTGEESLATGDADDA